MNTKSSLSRASSQENPLVSLRPQTRTLFTGLILKYTGEKRSREAINDTMARLRHFIEQMECVAQNLE
ncbi:hypothetical protein Hanom_Chr08g00681781 [Helianthus anomalus]